MAFDLGETRATNDVAQREQLAVRDLLESIANRIRHVDGEGLKLVLRATGRHRKPPDHSFAGSSIAMDCLRWLRISAQTLLWCRRVLSLNGRVDSDIRVVTTVVGMARMRARPSADRPLPVRLPDHVGSGFVEYLE